MKETSQINYTLIPLNETAEEELAAAYQTARSGGSKELTNNDSAYYVSAYTVISWEDVTVNSREYVTLTGVSGGYTAQGSGSYIASGVTVDSHTVTIGQSGKTLNNTNNSTISDSLSTSARTFSYSSSTFADWDPVWKTDSYTIMGATYVITLKRGTSTWTCEIVNNY